MAALPPVKFLHLSDTHQRITPEDVFTLPDADVFIHTGDFTNHGSLAEFQNFDLVLRAASERYPVRIVIFGNHDCYFFVDDFLKMKQLLPHATHVLLHETFDYFHPSHAVPIRIHGTPWYFCHTWDFAMKPDITPRPSGPHFHLIPPFVDLLLTHVPPRGPGYPSGSVQLLEEINAKKPKCHLFGHIHEMHGSLVRKGTGDSSCLFVNSSMMSRWGPIRLQNSPHMITATYNSAKLSWKFKSSLVFTDFSKITWITP